MLLDTLYPLLKIKKLSIGKTPLKPEQKVKDKEIAIINDKQK